MSEKEITLRVLSRAETEKLEAVLKHVLAAGVERVKIGETVFALSQPEKEDAAVQAANPIHEEAEQTALTLLHLMRGLAERGMKIRGACSITEAAEMFAALRPILQAE